MIPPSANDDGEDQISKSIAEKLKEVDPPHDSDPIPAIVAEARLEWPPIEADRSRRAEFGLSLMLVSIFVLILSSLIYPFDRLQGSVWFIYAWILMLLGAWNRDNGRGGLEPIGEPSRPRAPR